MTLPAMTLPQVLAFAVDKTPVDADVKAGWTAFALFVLLIVAVALLGWSLVRQLRKVHAAEQAGVYGRDDDDATSGRVSSGERSS